MIEILPPLCDNGGMNFFKGKKVTVMGLGLLGRGLGDVIFLSQEGAELIVTDLKTKEQLSSSLKSLQETLGDNFNKITFVLGEHRLEDFKDRDFILKAAGVPFDSIYIAEARKNNIPIEMGASLFAKLSGTTIIGITGTRGKTTVTHLLHDVITEAVKRGEIKYKKVFLGGNIRGVSTLQFLREAGKEDVAVLELDSWQMQGFEEAHMSPHISVFTTFFKDHMNYYKNDLDHYLDDKAAIFKYQNNNDVLVVGNQATEMITKKYPEIHSKVIVASEENIPSDWILKMPGIHNRYNAGLVKAAAEALTISDSTIKGVIENFVGVPGRLEFLCEMNGVKIYNDTTATTPDATLVALKALEKNIILIMGGADKQLDMTDLIQALPAHTKRVILLDGTGSARIESELVKNKGINLDKAASLKEAVEKAVIAAKEGDTIVLSPAFASFGMFKNEYDRGDQFNALVKNLK